MTLEEALAASEAEPVNDIFTVNPENRTISVPETEKIFGVFSDGNTERKHFRCPKVVGDGIDLTILHLYINYQNANGKKYPYLVEDVQADGDYITFSWLISPDVVCNPDDGRYYRRITMKTLNNLKMKIMVRAFRIRIKNGENIEDIAADYPALTVDDLEAIKAALEK